MFMPRLAALAFAFGCAACASQEPPSRPASARPDIAAQAAVRGQQLAAQTCAGCHAMAGGGASPMVEATPFREIVRRYPLDQLEEAFAEGLVTGHPAMPAFVFRASEIDDLIAYLETVKAEQ
ncbi:MAG: c-type cytochrome [Brevundimonas sp.]